MRDMLHALHAVLSPEVRDVTWNSNCAGEVFLDPVGEEENGLRLGHFQGDAALAAFAVAAHNAMVQDLPVDAGARRKKSQPRALRKLPHKTAAAAG